MNEKEKELIKNHATLNNPCHCFCHENGDEDECKFCKRVNRIVQEAILTAVEEREKEMIEAIKSVQPDMPHEMKGMVDDWDDYATGITDAKNKMLHALKGGEEIKCNCHYQCGCNKGECNCYLITSLTK